MVETYESLEYSLERLGRYLIVKTLLNYPRTLNFTKLTGCEFGYYYLLSRNIRHLKKDQIIISDSFRGSNDTIDRKIFVFAINMNINIYQLHNSNISE